MTVSNGEGRRTLSIQWFIGICFDIGLQVNGGGVVPPPKLLGL